ncbi:hypothetical protein P152DRAFT_60687 [Eremomyces bilateralis CBS 781.70]|uniref:Uncharacterized protein n=1 Tax=Eremomyces bilateralis CBS 781.70 TaxID=1392243 RepID=A0A6G1G0P5_9PEZI|nr:uncharacterized protein P152DRAFT_60687 [Eremomyces bilateralis CBS 781.70]KAF1811588.1 hypothetical protein P152DRAFT_60687 [Eremomyces bilateralis CBS 781.70]
MSSKRSGSTVGSRNFDPDAFFDRWTSSALPVGNDLRSAIIKAFGLPADDSYVYHAVASVTLAQVQSAINAGRQHGLHAWYIEKSGDTTEEQFPDPKDIEAYIAIFSPVTSTTKALAAFASNAKKGTPRAHSAPHLHAHLLLPPDTNLRLPAKAKPASLYNPEYRNPYLDLWSWSARTLDWSGPTPATAHVKQSHHVLPVLYHHFGCVCPSHDALSLIAQLCGSAAGQRKGATRPVVEIGSGNGYWAFVLRRRGVRVWAVDNAVSAWRTMWIGDTIRADGPGFLRRPPGEVAGEVGGAGAPGAVLLMVYPQVSGDFTARVVEAYTGDTIVVAGTQNENRFTGFAGETVEEWMARERKRFEKICQVPLPSFAGKDDALFIFKRIAGG